MKARIIIADDEENIRKTLAFFLREEGYQCDIADSGAKALDLVREGGIDLVLTDVRMPGMDGVELMKQVHQWSPETLVVLMTAFASVETAVAALRAGAADYFLKPWTSMSWPCASAPWFSGRNCCGRTGICGR